MAINPTDHSSIKIGAMSVATAPVRTARRVDRFTYAIRNIVTEAKKWSARAGAFATSISATRCSLASPAHLVEAVARAMRDGHNNYTASVGIVEAREAVAADFAARGVPVSPDRVLITSGTSRTRARADGHRRRRRILVPSPTYPLYTAVLAKIGATPVYYRTDPNHGWLPDLDDIRRSIVPATRALVVIDPNNPTGAVYPDEVRRELIAIAEEHGLVVLADEVYGDLAYEGPVAPMATLDLDASIISYSSLSKAYLAPAGVPDGWPWDRRRGWTRRSPPSRSSPMGACAVPVRCSTQWLPHLPATGRIRRYSARHCANAHRSPRRGSTRLKE